MIFALLFFALAAKAQAPPAESVSSPVEFSCPMDRDVLTKGPGKCPKCGMKLEAAIPNLKEYPVKIATRPAPAPAGRKTSIELRVLDPETGAAVREFEVIHEKPFHLFLVSEDLEYFEHAHPGARPDGAFQLDTVLPAPGIYRLLCDFYPKGGTPQLVPKTLTTAGYAAPLRKADLARDLAPKQAENLRVTLRLEPPNPIAGQKTLMFFTVDPGAGLEPLLGAWGHLLTVSADRIDMIHEHPAIADGGSVVQFNVIFPREAMYRVWVQFQRAGIVNTAVFTVPVAQLR